MSSTWASFLSMAKNSHKKLLPSGETVSRIPILDMMAHNWSLGLASFGGPTVHFQIFHRLFVDEYKWIDETTYQEMFALCQALSGPGSTKMIYGVNVLHYGFWAGGLGAFFVWSLPMAIAALGLAIGVGNVGEELPRPVYALLSGLNAATVGIIALAAVQLSRKAVTDTLTRILVFLGATTGMLYNALWYFPVLMVAGGVATIVSDLKLLQKGWKHLRMNNSNNEEIPREEGIELERIAQIPQLSTTALHERKITPTQTQEPNPTADREQPPAPTASTEPNSPLTKSWKTGTAILLAFFTTFTIIMICRGLYSGASRPFDLFANLFLAGTIIFGGGPVVIPLLREYVVTPGWVSPRDFILGLAITQIFPGPNFNFAVYLGALAVRNSSSSSSSSSAPAALGALIAFLAIFTPGIWLHTGFLGLWGTARRIQAVRAGLRGIHATAVGLVFTAVYRVFEIGYLDENLQAGASLSRDPWWVVIVATSFVGGMHFKFEPVVAIVVGAIMGLVWYAVVRG